ncbi:MAG: hypothetical protein K5864_01080 [Bacteroidales bacterium]|nr:hypothetical protein [Bacteroidales bacterium]
MKQSCPKCKTIIEINEKEYEPGSIVKKLCPLCSSSVSFTIGGNDPIDAAAFAKQGKELEDIKKQLGEVQASNKKLEETLSETLGLIKKQSSLIASQITNNNSQKSNNQSHERKENTACNPDQNDTKGMNDCRSVYKTKLDHFLIRERRAIISFLLLGFVIILLSLFKILNLYFVFDVGLFYWRFYWPLWLLLIVGIIIVVVSIHRQRKIKNEIIELKNIELQRKTKQDALPSLQQSKSSIVNDSVSKRNTKQVASPNLQQSESSKSNDSVSNVRYAGLPFGNRFIIPSPILKNNSFFKIELQNSIRGEFEFISNPKTINLAKSTTLQIERACKIVEKTNGFSNVITTRKGIVIRAGNDWIIIEKAEVKFTK